MVWFDKVKTYHSFIFSAVFHLLIVALLLKIFSENSEFNLVPEIQPVAVISGSDFEAIKAKFFKHKKKSIATQVSKVADIALNQEVQKEKQKGSKKSDLKNGLNLDLDTKTAKDYNNSYVNIIANKIEQNKSYISMSSAPNDIRTEVVLKVVLDSGGKLVSYKFAKKCDYNFFNKAAVRILEMSAPFPAPSTKLASLEFDIPIFFDTI
jgi:TonB family protein